MVESSVPGQAGWLAKLTLEYDGTSFAGSQAQANGRTVQGEVEAALQRLTGEWRRIALAGRTDAGVHALGQVASVPAPMRFTADRLRRGLNALLPPDVAVVAVERMDPGFHARFSAISRRYAYNIWNGPERSPLVRATAWHLRQPLDIAAMQQAGLALIGTHDFASFAGAGHGVPRAYGQFGSTRRTLTEITVDTVEMASGQLVRCEIEAGSFLPHMVRNIVGGLIEVGLGRWSSQTIADVLIAADRRRSARTAPAHGVTLVRVTYPES